MSKLFTTRKSIKEIRLISYLLRRLTSRKRSTKTNRSLGVILTFVAGATNAGGFLAVHQYTSHMTGVISVIADDVALGGSKLALASLGALISFVLGAMCSAILINWARRANLRSEYALPLLLEAILLLCFGLLGANLSWHVGLFSSVTVLLLCFIMGLQNAIITKISKAEIRTTHMTGIVTDLGIELGKLCYWNIRTEESDQPIVQANLDRLRLLSTLLSMFFLGGISGALGFKHIGFSFTVFLAVLLSVLAVIPVVDDVVEKWRE